jgi:hypothetical protein
MESLESNIQKFHPLPVKRSVPFFSWVFSRSIFWKEIIDFAVKNYLWVLKE